MHTSYGYTSRREDLLDTTRYQEAEDGPKGFTRRVEQTTFNHTAAIPLKDGSIQELVLPLARDKSPDMRWPRKIGLVFKVYSPD